MYLQFGYSLVLNGFGMFHIYHSLLTLNLYKSTRISAYKRYPLINNAVFGEKAKQTLPSNQRYIHFLLNVTFILENFVFSSFLDWVGLGIPLTSSRLA